MDDIAIWLGRGVMIAGGIGACAGLLYVTTEAAWKAIGLTAFGAACLKDGYCEQKRKRRARLPT